MKQTPIQNIMHTQFFIHPNQSDDELLEWLAKKGFEQEPDDSNEWISKVQLNHLDYRELLKYFRTSENNHKHFMIIEANKAWAHPYSLLEALKSLSKISPAVQTLQELFINHTRHLNKRDFTPALSDEEIKEISEAIIFDTDSLKTWKTHTGSPSAE